MTRLLLVAFFAETGLVLMLAPWSTFWDRNYFTENLPLLRAFAINDFVRGAVTGVGVLNVGAAAAEMLAFLAERRAADRVSSIRDFPVDGQ